MENMNMNWNRLAAMAILSFVSMYILMYVMVDSFANVYPNLNEFYMAGLMTALMMVIEMAVMRAMYGKTTIVVTSVISIAGVILFWSLIRNQTAVSDKEFLRSMIPHHASALLMCEKADIKDAEIKQLCASIISGQQSEIDWMKAKLLRMN